MDKQTIDTYNRETEKKQDSNPFRGLNGIKKP